MTTARRSTVAAVGAGTLLAALLGTSGPAQAAADPFTDPSTGATSTYTVVADNSYTWPQARDAAAATPAPDGCTNHLVVITSQAEQDYVDSSLGSLGGLWLGGQRGESGDFEWVTGEAFGYTNWASGEPNNTSPGEPYAQFTGDNQWNDIFSDNASGYVLETQCAKQTPPPVQRAVVTSVSPSSGPRSGQTTVVISGDHFTGAKKVTFASRSAVSFTVDSDDQITATTPAYEGTVPKKGKAVPVRVVTKGVSAKSSSARFTYRNDAVTARR